MNGFLYWLLPTAAAFAAVAVPFRRSRRCQRDGLGSALWVLGVGLIAIVATGIVRWGTLTAETHACHPYGEATGRNVRLVDTGPIAWTCFVEVDGEWFPLEQVFSQREDES